MKKAFTWILLGALLTVITVTIYDKTRESEIAPNDTTLQSGAVQVAISQAETDTNMPKKDISIIKAETTEWPNGCLGLAREDEFCTEALVQGYKIEIKAGEETIIYRTNNDGSVIRKEN